MYDLQLFLLRTTVELGIGPTQAESAVEGLIRFVTEQLGPMDGLRLLDALPGSHQLLAEHLGSTHELRPPGAFTHGSPSATNPAIAGRLGLLEVVKAADLDTSTAMALMEMFLVELRSRTTAEFVDRVVARVAELRGPRARAAEAI